MFRPLIEQLFERRGHWLKWVGDACLIAGVFFAIKDYIWQRPMDRGGQGLAALIARLLGSSID